MSRALRYEVAIVGGGPAGLSLAIHLARARHSVLIVSDGRTSMLGEHLRGEGVIALEQLGVDVQQVGEPCAATLTAWGSASLKRESDLFSASGRSLIIDRPSLEGALRRCAAQAGVTLIDGSVSHVEQREHGVEIALDATRVRACVIVDATGRCARIARALGARRLRADGSVALTALLPRSPDEHERVVLVESCPSGFWYSVPLSEGRISITHFGDSPPRAENHEHKFERALYSAQHTCARVASPQSFGQLRVQSACSQRLDRAAFGRALAVGDAAMAWDPLSASGLVNALVGARSASAHIDAFLRGHPEALNAYAIAVESAFARYLHTKSYYYHMERRYPDASFWAARQGRYGIYTPDSS